MPLLQRYLNAISIQYGMTIILFLTIFAFINGAAALMSELQSTWSNARSMIIISALSLPVHLEGILPLSFAGTLTFLLFRMKERRELLTLPLIGISKYQLLFWLWPSYLFFFMLSMLFHCFLIPLSLSWRAHYIQHHEWKTMVWVMKNQKSIQLGQRMLFFEPKHHQLSIYAFDLPHRTLIHSKSIDFDKQKKALILHQGSGSAWNDRNHIVHRLTFHRGSWPILKDTNFDLPTHTMPNASKHPISQSSIKKWISDIWKAYGYAIKASVEWTLLMIFPCLCFSPYPKGRRRDYDVLKVIIISAMYRIFLLY